jgi:hypothetical protein
MGSVTARELPVWTMDRFTGVWYQKYLSDKYYLPIGRL